MVFLWNRLCFRFCFRLCFRFFFLDRSLFPVRQFLHLNFFSLSSTGACVPGRRSSFRYFLSRFCLLYFFFSHVLAFLAEKAGLDFVLQSQGRRTIPGLSSRLFFPGAVPAFLAEKAGSNFVLQSLCRGSIPGISSGLFLLGLVPAKKAGRYFVFQALNQIFLVRSGFFVVSCLFHMRLSLPYAAVRGANKEMDRLTGAEGERQLAGSLFRGLCSSGELNDIA